MVFDRNTVFALTEKSKKGQEPEQMSRYTAHVTEKAEETRGRGYLNTRRKPRRKRKEYLWKRIYRYMKCCPGICTPAISGRRKWWKTQYSGVMSLTR